MQESILLVYQSSLFFCHNKKKYHIIYIIFNKHYTMLHLPLPVHLVDIDKFSPIITTKATNTAR